MSDAGEPVRRALLIGTETYEDSGLPDVPAVANSLSGMRQVLLDPGLCGWREDEVRVLKDWRGPADQALELSKTAEEADVLVFYFVGHGRRLGTGELLLCLTNTSLRVPEETGFLYSRARTIIQRSPAALKIVILDCCYSGEATRSLSPAMPSDLVVTRGVVTLTASFADDLAHVVDLASQRNSMTSFTEQFVQLIREGLPEGGPRLTLKTIFTEVRNRLLARGLPEPDFATTNLADSFAFTRNAWQPGVSPLPLRPPIPTEFEAQPRSSAARHGVSRRKTLALGGAAVVSVTAAGVAGASFLRSPAGLGMIPSSGVQLGGTLSGHTKGVSDVVFGKVGNTPVAVSAGLDGMLFIWDLRSRERFMPPLKGHDGEVWSVAFTSVQGKPVIVSGGLDQTVRIWSLDQGTARARVLTGHTATVKSLAVGAYQGRPAVFSGSEDGTVRVWDPESGRRLHDPFPYPEKVVALAVCTVDGKPVLLAGCNDHAVHIRDLESGTSTTSLVSHAAPVEAMAVTMLDGVPVAITGSPDKTVLVWNLSTRKRIGAPLVGHTDWVWGVATGMLNGDVVAVSVGDDVGRVWDLTRSGDLRETMPSQQTSVWAVATGTIASRSLAVTGNLNGIVRLWDLNTLRT